MIGNGLFFTLCIRTASKTFRFIDPAGAPDPACRSVKRTVRPGDEVGPAAFDAGAVQGGHIRCHRLLAGPQTFESMLSAHITIELSGAKAEDCAPSRYSWKVCDVKITHDEDASFNRFVVALREAKGPSEMLVAFQSYGVDRRSEVGETYVSSNASTRLTQRGRTLGLASLGRVKARRTADPVGSSATSADSPSC